MMEVPPNSHHQATMASHQMCEVISTPKTQQQQQQQERKPRPQSDESLKCPRCASTNTKFCYYNNYSLSQPRYFCKSCRRYWTQGGSLRNVPVGGGCRKNKRTSSSPNINPIPIKNTQPQFINATSSISLVNSLVASQMSSSLSNNDLTLAFVDNKNIDHSSIPTYGFLDILKSGFMDNSSDLNNLYCGFGANYVNKSKISEEQGNSSCKELDHDQGENKINVMGVQWVNDGDLGLESSARDYWCNGLINSSLI